MWGCSVYQISHQGFLSVRQRSCTTHDHAQLTGSHVLPNKELQPCRPQPRDRAQLTYTCAHNTHKRDGTWKPAVLGGNSMPQNLAASGSVCLFSPVTRLYSWVWDAAKISAYVRGSLRWWSVCQPALLSFWCFPLSRIQGYIRQTKVMAFLLLFCDTWQRAWFFNKNTNFLDPVFS